MMSMTAARRDDAHNVGGAVTSAMVARPGDDSAGERTQCPPGTRCKRQNTGFLAKERRIRAAATVGYRARGGLFQLYSGVVVVG